jgi:hypothetical protein
MLPSFSIWEIGHSVCIMPQTGSSSKFLNRTNSLLTPELPRISCLASIPQSSPQFQNALKLSF